MKAWLKGGLWGLGISIIFILISLLRGLSERNPFLETVLLLNKYLSFLSPNGRALLIGLIIFTVIFFIGSLVGSIIGKIKSNKNK